MLPVPDGFEFDYFGTDLVYGRGCIDRLGETLADRGLDRALVVCGSNVGANRDVMAPVERGLGDRIAGVFDETTPAKRAETAYDGIEATRRVDADVLVGVGGGSSLDIARQMSVFADDGRSLDDLRAAAREGRLDPPDTSGSLTPVVVVPTTFAGADVSAGGSIEVLAPEESPTGQPVRVSGSNMPAAVFHDPDLFETTPVGALAGSAMNGFDKGLETIYGRDASAITDATAIHGLRLLSGSLPNLSDPDAMDRAVAGGLLVQFRRGTNVIHAFGHGFARRYDLQQGVAHAVMAPHVLRYVLDRADARPGLLAAGLGVEGDADAIVGAVAGVRDALDLPSRLRDLDPVREDDLPAIAEYILNDPSLHQGPADLDPTVEDLEAVLRAAW